MAAVVIGILFLTFTVYSVVPGDWALQWWPYVLDFLKGGIPVLTLLIGLVAILIGIADIRDRMEEKKKANNPDASGDSVSAE